MQEEEFPEAEKTAIEIATSRIKGKNKYNYKHVEDVKDLIKKVVKDELRYACKILYFYPSNTQKYILGIMKN